MQCLILLLIDVKVENIRHLNLRLIVAPSCETANNLLLNDDVHHKQINSKKNLAYYSKLFLYVV